MDNISRVVCIRIRKGFCAVLRTAPGSYEIREEKHSISNCLAEDLQRKSPPLHSLSFPRKKLFKPLLLCIEARTFV